MAAAAAAIMMMMIMIMVMIMTAAGDQRARCDGRHPSAHATRCGLMLHSPPPSLHQHTHTHNVIAARRVTMCDD